MKKRKPASPCPRCLRDKQPSSSPYPGSGALRRRLLEMGLTPGTDVTLRKRAPLGDPLELSLRGYELSLRAADALHIEVEVSRTC